MNYISDRPGNSLIRENDICVIHISEQIRYIFKIEPKAELQTKFGLVKAENLLNYPYGVRFECKRGWILPLRLTPELWTQLLPHRTQILYQADISMILIQLDIKPGSIVVESGTGSGSLSHAILRACLPNGFLHTFDFNESRVDEASREFVNHGFENNVKVENRNVCESGYGEELEGKADACVLDLPQTWLAIEHAYKILKPDGSRLCTFSPCIEQVQQNVTKMADLGLKDIVTMECLLRPLEVKKQELRMWTDSVLDGLLAIDKVRIEDLKNNLNPSKQARTIEEPKIDNLPSDSNDTSTKLLNHALMNPRAPFSPHLLPKTSHIYAKQPAEIVSHSGYLTFASKRR